MCPEKSTWRAALTWPCGHFSPPFFSNPHILRNVISTCHKIWELICSLILSTGLVPASEENVNPHHTRIPAAGKIPLLCIFTVLLFHLFYTKILRPSLQTWRSFTTPRKEVGIDTNDGTGKEWENCQLYGGQAMESAHHSFDCLLTATLQDKENQISIIILHFWTRLLDINSYWLTRGTAHFDHLVNQVFLQQYVM